MEGQNTAAEGRAPPSLSEQETEAVFPFSKRFPQHSDDLMCLTSCRNAFALEAVCRVRA